MKKNKITFKRLIKWLLIFVGLIVISAFISYLFIGAKLFQSINFFLDHTSYGIFVGLTFWLGNSIIGYLTANKIDWKKSIQRANIISLLSFIIFGIIASMFVPYIHGKYYNHLSADNLREHVLFNSFINLSIDIILLSIYYSTYLIKYWKISIESEEELKRENLITKYEALKNQVNPHFLFNSLNTLTGIVEQDAKTAVEYIKHLSNTYRYVLEQRDKELVTIEEELKFVDDYIFLSKLRHGAGLNYNVSITSHNKTIVPLGLQILIENCIKHNIIDDDLPLKIEIIEEDDYLIVKNNFQKKNTISKEVKTGLDNLTNRYTFLTSRPVLIEENTEQFIVKIPIIEKPHR